MRETGPDDPKGLIYEAFHMPDIGVEEARSIFLDWALGLPSERSQTGAVTAMLTKYGTDAPDHPMTAVLTEALTPAAKPRRRGGWQSRRRS